MNYLVDGHNLIPKTGVALNELDDETGLLAQLQVFARLGRHRVEVFFDGAPPGKSGKKQEGVIVAHYVRKGRTADESIVARLNQLGKEARNWTVVTSDRQVQGEGHMRQAQVLSSEAFAGLLHTAQAEAQKQRRKQPQGEMSAEELEAWLRLFGGE
jgi:uncharacterized protein